MFFSSCDSVVGDYLTQSGRPGKGFSEKVVFEKRAKDKEELILNKRGGREEHFRQREEDD